MSKPLYVNTAFENGSPLDWEVTSEGVLELWPQFDYEHGPQGNRQLTHWHFRLHGEAGQTLRLRMPPRENIYGGRRGPAFVARTGNSLSADGVHWQPFSWELDEDKGLAAEIVLAADVVHIARIEPYTTRHLAAWLERLQADTRTKVEIIGQTVEGRDLELVTLSAGLDRPAILFRGRAHPWEAGGSWFLEGVAAEALRAPDVLAACDLVFLPMAGKDGVVRGQTRFNLNGIDLNRGFVPGYDFSAAPENQALVGWLLARQAAGRLPLLALDLHDDDYGNLHVGHGGGHPDYDRRMATLEELMRARTYFTEGAARGVGAVTFGAGLLELFGFDSAVLELNSNWLAGANCIPGSAAWRDFGAQFAAMLPEYLARTRDSL